MTTNFDTNKIYLSKGLKESCYAVALQQLQTSIISSRIAWDYFTTNRICLSYLVTRLYANTGKK
jgi:hypothetical protein